MSTSYGNHIPIMSHGKELKGTISKIKTDSAELGSPLNKETPLFSLLSLFDSKYGAYFNDGLRDGEKYGYGHAKMDLQNEIELFFKEAREKKENIKDEFVIDVLHEGSKKVRSMAQEKLGAVKEALGLK
jgi:tryptophanyl-tRNA synthetase